MPITAHAVLRNTTPATYDALRDALGALQRSPEGALCHVVWWDGPDAHVLDVWDERAHLETFLAERVAPTAPAVGLTALPEMETFDAHEVFLRGRTVHAPTAVTTLPADHVQTLREGYAAFGRGDVPAVLGMMAEDVTWTSPASLPFGGTFRGRPGVAAFFTSLPVHFAELSVTPDRFVADDDVVVVLGHHAGRTTAGQPFELPFSHVWTFRDGMAAEFAEHLDTAALNAALTGRSIDLRDQARSGTSVS